MSYAYHGKLLYVDLTTGKSRIEKVDDKYFRKYTGGSIMASVKLLQETEAGLDAFDPEAYLMFFPGLLSGFDAPGLARAFILGKSPLTGGIGEARVEGTFAVALKKSGFDGIIISGKSDIPSILIIENGIPRIEAAGHMWGQTVSSTDDLLKEKYPDASTAIIGPAGENKVRFANIICDKNHQASRGGMGAVMGAKQLKALLLLGGELPAVYDSVALEQTCKSFETRMKENVLSMWQHDRPGFGAWIHTHGTDAALCVNNYQTSTCNYADQYRPEKFDRFYQGEAPCPSCPNNCIKRYAATAESGKHGGLHQEAIGALGPNIGNGDLEKIIEANVFCNDYGMDPNALGFVVSFAQECRSNGLIDVDLDLSFTGDVDLLPLAERIALREGIGDVLAEGAFRAGQIIGKGAEKYAMTVKGNEMVATEARTQTNLALGYATAAIGPRYDICEHDWDYDIHVGWEHTMNNSRTLRILERIPMDYLGEEKVKNYKSLNTVWAAVDALGMCIFASAPTRIYSLIDMAHLFHDISGFETSSYEIMRIGDMKNQLFRIYNLREGLGSADDTLPDRFFESEIDDGTFKGVKLDREKFDEVIKFYYSMMGWDENGKPSKATLYEHGLEWIVKD